MDPQFPSTDPTNDESSATPEAGAPEVQDALVPSSPDGEATPPEPNAAVRQLESMLQNLSSYAKPVLRQIAVRAAEVAARAADAAGPVAQRAADVTEDLGGRLAARSREFASDLRKAPAETAEASAPNDTSESSEPAAPSEPSEPGSDDAPGS